MFGGTSFLKKLKVTSVTLSLVLATQFARATTNNLVVTDLFSSLDEVIERNPSNLSFDTYNVFEEQNINLLKEVVLDPSTERVGFMYWEDAIRDFITDYSNNFMSYLDLRKKTEEQLKISFLNLSKVFKVKDEKYKAYLLPSFQTFNGMAIDSEETSSQEEALFLSLDTLKKRNDDLSLVTSHEMFHLFHYKNLKGKVLYENITSPLWVEGLSVYYTSLEQPKKSLGQLLSDPELGKACADAAQVRSAAMAYLRDSSVSIEDEDLYNEKFIEWFFKKKPPEVSRLGYCLGYRVVKLLSKKHTLQQMITWDSKKFSPKVKEALRALSNTQKL